MVRGDEPVCGETTNADKHARTRRSLPVQNAGAPSKACRVSQTQIVGELEKKERKAQELSQGSEDLSLISVTQPGQQDFWISDFGLRIFKSAICNHQSAIGWPPSALRPQLALGVPLSLSFNYQSPAISLRPLPSILTLPNGARRGQANIFPYLFPA